jgi:outer membrane lipoprotein-sorting protein
MLRMRRTTVLTMVLTASILAVAAEAKPVSEPPKAKEKTETPLEEVLHKWAKADDSVRERHVRYTMTLKDHTFETTTVTKGETFFKKPDLCRVDVRDNDGRRKESWLLDSKRLHIFNYEAKTERIIPFPILPLQVHQKDGNQIVTSGWLESLLSGWEEGVRWQGFGPQARVISPRFNVRLGKKDRWYIYLDIAPRDRVDKRWFIRCRVTLDSERYQVRQLWMEAANGNETTWDFDDIKTNPEPSITRESLLKGLPKGWKRIELPANEDADKQSSRP